MKINSLTLWLWAFSITAVVIAVQFLPVIDAAEIHQTSSAGITVDHNSVDASQIPQEWLNAARVLDTFFAHRSVGSNILTGMADLQGQNPERYSIMVSSGSPNWFASNSGIMHQSLGINGEPYTKIDGFDDYVQGGFSIANVAMMKFCPGDTKPFGHVPAEDIWHAYKDMMTVLEATYPDTTFVWWTMPIFTAADDRGNDEKEVFNELIRDYCAANVCVLFDIADIESHDPDGNPVTSTAGYEAMWNGYSYDGGHLNETGRVRVAKAYWWLLARIAGWEFEPNPAPDLSVSISPELVEVVQGNSAEYTVSVELTEGFDDPVSLNTSGLPAEAEISWEFNPLPPNQYSTLTIDTDGTVATGEYIFNVVGMVDGVTDQTMATLRVIDKPSEPGFTLSVEPEEVEVIWNDEASYTVTVEGVGGFQHSVQLETLALPEEAEVIWDVNPLPIDQSTTLMIIVNSLVPAGDYPFSIRGSVDSRKEVVNATLGVRQPLFLPAICSQ